MKASLVAKYKVDMNDVRFRVKTTSGRWAMFGVPAPVGVGINWDTLGRFTGQLDDNKTPIWEGDILDCQVELDMGFGVSIVNSRGLMIFNKTMGAYVIEIPSEDDKMAEAYNVVKAVVIGNLADHPELLCEPLKPIQN